MEIDRTSQTWIDGKRIVVDFYRVATGTDELSVPMDALKETIAAVESLGIYTSIETNVTVDWIDSYEFGTQLRLEIIGYRQLTEAEMANEITSKAIRELYKEYAEWSVKNIPAGLSEDLYKQVVIQCRAKRHEINLKIQELEAQKKSTHAQPE